MKHQFLYGLQRGEKVYGIPDEDTLEKLIRNGSLQSSDMLFCYRRGIWSPAGELPELKPRFMPVNMPVSDKQKQNDAIDLSAYASVGSTDRLIVKVKKDELNGGSRRAGSTDPPEKQTDGRGNSGIMIFIIALLLLLMSLLLAARLYLSSGSDRQLSYHFDTAYTATGTNNSNDLMNPQR